MRFTRRWLLSVVCSSFGDPLAEDESIPYAPLPFSGPLSEELSERLADFGYMSAARLVDLPAAELGKRVEDFLDSCGVDEVVVVHVIGHGTVHERTAKLLVVGGDGQAGARTEVERWLTAVESRAGGAAPSVLFLVDLCYAGTVTRLDWQGHIPDEERRAWVIAATGQRDLAYAGRFSKATSAVLARIAAGALDIAASYEFVPIERVAREIRREVDQLSEGRYGQRVVSIRSDPAAVPDFPFIPNPAYVDTPTVQIDETTRPFLDNVDEALDWRHFAGRASGGILEMDGDRARPGAFRGRHRELRTIAGVFDAPAPRPGLVLVTGSPGAGKSALLGITVCATHPGLSNLTESLWRDHRDDLPAIHDNLAAVHCRQRHLGEIVAALARQLGVPVLTSDPKVLREALTDVDAVPPVVLDALDESMDPINIMNNLILPLSEVARVVIGVRPWHEFDPLRDSASTVIDLDDVPEEELRADLAAYVDDLLRPTYRTAALRESRQAIATTVAETLTEPITIARTVIEAEVEALTSADDARWGAFLVAGLYAQQLRNRPVLADLAQAQAAGRAVPRTLPEVFELDLNIGDRQSWRPVLTVLANSYGAGMPRSLVDAVVSSADVSAVLDAARFYLRRDIDRDGTILYRLFHQGLADHLRRQDQEGKEALFIALTSTLGSPPRWRDAEPYLLRHATNHAATVEQVSSLLEDPGFLTFAEPSAIWRDRMLLAGRPAITGLIYGYSAGKHRYLSPVRRRSMLVIDAHRLGYRYVADQLARIPDLPALGWTSLWATTEMDTVREWERALNDASPSSLAIGGSPDAPLVAVGDWTGLSVTDVATRDVTVIPAETLDETFRCEAVGRWDGRVVALISRAYRPFELWDVTNQTPLFVCDKLGGRDCVVFIEDAGMPLLVAVDVHRGLMVWRMSDGKRLMSDDRRPIFDGKRHSGHRFGQLVDAVAVGSVGGHAVVVMAYKRRLELVWITGRTKPVSVDINTRVGSLAIGDFDGQGLVLCGHSDGSVDLRNARDLTWIRRLVPGDEYHPIFDDPNPLFDDHPWCGPLALGRRHNIPVAYTASQFDYVDVTELVTGVSLPGTASRVGSLRTLLPGVVAGQPVMVAATGQAAEVYDVDTHERLASFAGAKRQVDLGQDGPVVVREHRGAVRGVAVLDDMVASASTDQTVRLWDRDTGTLVRVLDGHRDWVHTVTMGRSGGRRVALSGGADCQAQLCDVDSGELLRVFTGHEGWIRAAAFTPESEPCGVTAAHDGTVRVWDLGTGECVRVLTPKRQTPFTSVACGPVVVAGGIDGLVHIWRSAKSPAKSWALAGHKGRVWAVALSRVDGVDVILSGGEDHVVRMWRVTDGACVRTFHGFTAKVTTLSTGLWHDRAVLLAGSDDGTVLGWDLGDSGLLAEATFPGTVSAVGIGADGVVAVGFGNDVGFIRLSS